MRARDQRVLAKAHAAAAVAAEVAQHGAGVVGVAGCAALGGAGGGLVFFARHRGTRVCLVLGVLVVLRRVGCGCDGGCLEVGYLKRCSCFVMAVGRREEMFMAELGGEVGSRF